MAELTLEKLVNLCKQYGFIYQGSEIYGGLANTWDSGPLGSRLKNNIKDTWRKRYIQERDNSYEVDAAILPLRQFVDADVIVVQQLHLMLILARRLAPPLARGRAHGPGDAGGGDAPHDELRRFVFVRPAAIGDGGKIGDRIGRSVRTAGKVDDHVECGRPCRIERDAFAGNRREV